MNSPLMTLNFRTLSAIVLLIAARISPAFGQTPEEFEAKLIFKNGVVNVGNGIATLNLSSSFRYLEPQMAEKVLVAGWGNPPESANGNLGMIFPADGTPAVSSWGIIITYEEDGYVDDTGADKINYDKMADEIRAGLAEENPERIKQGYPALSFIGWAEQPHYDKSNHKLYWAKEIKFGDQAENTLNYNIRVLGRSGVLVLNAVAMKEQLAEISAKSQELLPLIDFNPGHKYADYIPGTDKVAEYGIAALVAGVAAKAGLFKWLIALLIAGKKLLIFAAIAVAAFAKKLFGKKVGRNSSVNVPPPDASSPPGVDSE